MNSRLLALAALVSSAVAFAKPLYLTVPRAFGPEEAPTVDVSFAGRGPVELRVLKPADRCVCLCHPSSKRACPTPCSKFLPLTETLDHSGMTVLRIAK